MTEPQRSWFALLVALSLLAWQAGCRAPEPEADEEGADPAKLTALVTLQPIARRDVRELVDGVGALGPLVGGEARVAARVPGMVARLLADEGAEVAAGKPLLELDTTELAAAVRGAEAELARARSGEELARQELARQTSLLARGLVARREAAAAEAGLEQAAQAVASATSAIELARAEASWALVRSPVSGVILERAVAPGQYVQADAMLYRVAPIDELDLACMVPAASVARVKPGQAVDVLCGAVSTDARHGSVTRVSPQLSAGSDTATVHITLANPDRSLLPGALCRARIVVAEHAGALVVPGSSRPPGGRFDIALHACDHSSG